MNKPRFGFSSMGWWSSRAREERAGCVDFSSEKGDVAVALLLCYSRVGESLRFEEKTYG